MAFSILSITLILAVICSLLFQGSSDSHVRGCPFDSICSFGVADSSPIDQLATAFHLPSPKLYSHRERVGGRAALDYHYGASFAAEKAMALPKHFLESQGIRVPSGAFSTDSATSQLVSFSEYLLPICHSRLQCRNKLERALFVLDLGGNDYRYAFLNGKSIELFEEITPVIVTNIGSVVSQIRKQGGSNFLVSGLLPLGCLPGYVSLLHNPNPADFDADNCHVGLNNLAKNHNDQLKLALLQEWPQHGAYAQDEAVPEPEGIPTDSRVLFGDYYDAFMDLLREKGSSKPRALFEEDGFRLAEDAKQYMVGKLISGKKFFQPELHLPKMNHCVM